MVQKTNNTNKILMLIAMVWLGSFKVQAQLVSDPFPWMDGHYNNNLIGVPGKVDVQLDRDTTLEEGQTYYADNDRAQVKGITIVAGNYIRFRLSTNISHRHGMFKYGNTIENFLGRMSQGKGYRFFLIQMRATNPNFFNEYNNGLCYEIKTSLRDTSNGIYTFVAIANNFNGPLPVLDSTGNAVIQIVRVPMFKNFTLNGGVVTCHSYDGHTGGVLAMRPFLLKLKSGYFNVAGKGYFPENVSWGLPSAGAMGDLAHNNIATNTIDREYKRICPDSIGLNLLYGNFGTGGDPAVPNIINGTTTSGTRLYYGRQHTTKGGIPTVFPIMGSAGYFVAGQQAGNGAEGGGHGGIGGGSQNGNSGLGGSTGSDGEAGGTVGKGGRGGGIIMLKIASVSYLPGHIYNNPSSKLFYINGKNGGYGGNGGAGGDGGIGGQGANGSIVGNTVYYRGGIGASGAGGAGGTGGDGSNGGDPGCLSLYMQNFFNRPSGGIATASHIKKLTDLSPGKGGFGGSGGFKGRSQEQIQQNDPSPLPNNKLWCGTGGGSSNTPQMQHICNCDSVFWALSSGLASTVNGNGTAITPYHYNFNTGLNQYDVYGKKDTGEVHLWSTHKGGLIRSHCYLRNSRDCNPMADKIKGSPTLLLGGGYVQLQGVAAVRISTLPLVVIFKKGNQTPYTDAFEWNGGYSYNGTLTDIIQPANPVCYQGTCYKSDPLNRALQSIQGNLQNDGDTAIVDESPQGGLDEQNIGLFDGKDLPPPQNDNDNKGKGELSYIEIGTQANQFTVLFPAKAIGKPIETINYQIINSIGQVLNKGKINAANQWQISTANMASGIYTLILNTENGKFIHKFVVVN